MDEVRKMDGILQGVFSNLIWWIILLVGGGVIAFLKISHPEFVPPILYGIGTMALLAIIFYVVTGHSLLSKPHPQIDAGNVEDNVKIWIYSLGLAYQPVSVPDTDFAYKVTLSNGTGVVVGRNAKQKTGYLQFQVLIGIAPEHKVALSQLTDDQANTFAQELSLELARAKIGYSLNGPDPKHLETVGMVKGVPLASLSEANFAASLDEMDSVSALVRTSVPLILHRYTSETKPPASSRTR